MGKKRRRKPYSSRPGEQLSKAYDMVVNGAEIGGGSVRIHRRDVQQAVYRVLGVGEKEAEQKFGFLLRASQQGCPPHRGIAFGLDRIAAPMSGATSIREVVAFPKTQTANHPLTGAPSPAKEKPLLQPGIRLRKAKDKPK